MQRPDVEAGRKGPSVPGSLVDGLREALARRERRLLGWERYARTAVLLPLLQRNGEWHLLFEVRAQTLRRQPGEVCFPGGFLEPEDASPEAAAVRETSEELNLDPKTIQVVGPLDVLITPWRLIIYPFVGVLLDPEQIDPAREEIEQVFTVPLTEILQATPDVHQIRIRLEPPDHFPFEKIPGGRAYPWRQTDHPELFFEFEGHVVWGLTALILDHFRSVVREVAP